MDLQFYPTPPALAARAWAKFKNRDFVRVLEPSAGRGDLMGSYARDAALYRRGREVPWDAIEIDATHHPILRERGAKVVGFDFLKHEVGAIYSHIILNPPFARGAEHVLHAWDLLYSGEVVAIINAETLRNPCSRERQLLAELVRRHGSVEFIADAFQGPGVERQADVEIALVHLTKTVEPSAVVGDVLGELSAEQGRASDGLHFHGQAELALPTGFVEDLVLRFNAAVRTAREAYEATARASYYRRLLGRTLEERNRGEHPGERGRDGGGDSGVAVRNLFDKAYDELKNAAWAGVLRSTEVLSRLSSSAQKRMESEFTSIKELEFTAANIYGFLRGLAESAGTIQLGMICDVFDTITRFHSVNAVYFMGWKSNDRHRTAGMRLKTTRFVLPGHGVESYQSSLDFGSRKQLSDFDKVFALLDGKSVPEYGLEALFEREFQTLRRSVRCSCSYFDVRYYPKRGTIHFFPRRADLMDRLNRVVGQQRQWLPPNLDEAGADFLKQYEQAERFDAEVREAFEQQTAGMPSWRRPTLSDIANPEREQFAQAQEILAGTLERVLDAHGIHPFARLEMQPEMLLLVAA